MENRQTLSGKSQLTNVRTSMPYQIFIYRYWESQQLLLWLLWAVSWLWCDLYGMEFHCVLWRSDQCNIGMRELYWARGGDINRYIIREKEEGEIHRERGRKRDKDKEREKDQNREKCSENWAYVQTPNCVND